MRVAYINSNGKTFEFTNNDLIKIKDADFHKYTYDYEGVDLAYGMDLTSFKKSPSVYQVELYFYGSPEKREKMISELHDAAEFDRDNKKKGKLIWGDWYIECYVIESDTYPKEYSNNITIQEISFLCPHPFWTKEMNYQFAPQKKEDATDGLDFPIDFPIDFAPDGFGTEIREIDHYTENEFIMRFYGPCANPKVSINGYPYQIFVSLEQNEYLEINSKENSVIKHLANGTIVDIYNSRSFENSVFKKIPSGRMVVTWDGNFGIDLVLFLERSVPKR